MKKSNCRVYIREYKQSDFDKYFALVSDPAVRELSFLSTPDGKVEAMVEFKKKRLYNSNKEQSLHVFGAFLKESDLFIGDVGYTLENQQDDSGIAEIGFFLSHKFWNKGYATEIASILIKTIFTNHNIHKITACCDSRNKASEKVMIKAGMKIEGLFKQHRFKKGNWFDELKYGLLKEDWLYAVYDNESIRNETVSIS